MLILWRFEYKLKIPYSGPILWLCNRPTTHNFKYLEKISLPTLCVSFSPPKNPILSLILPYKDSVFIYQTFFKSIHMCFQLFKNSVRIYRTFFKGINRNSKGEKEKQRMGREIFIFGGLKFWKRPEATQKVLSNEKKT
jgi:hypothetical protein